MNMITLVAIDPATGQTIGAWTVPDDVFAGRAMTLHADDLMTGAEDPGRYRVTVAG